MRRTRKDPPTMLELQKDAARQARLADNVEQLRLAYVEEKKRAKDQQDQYLSAPEGRREDRDGMVAIGPAADEVEDVRQALDSSEMATDAGAEETRLGDDELARRAKLERERERELIKQKKEAFGMSIQTRCELSRMLTNLHFRHSSSKSDLWSQQGQPERQVPTRELESCCEATLEKLSLVLGCSLCCNLAAGNVSIRGSDPKLFKTLGSCATAPSRAELFKVVNRRMF